MRTMADKLTFGNFKLGILIYGSLWLTSWGALFYLYNLNG